MSPYFLENLYQSLGRPVWFWPAVMAVILVLWGLSADPEVAA